MNIQHVNPDGLLSLPEYSQVVVSPPGRLAFIAATKVAVFASSRSTT